MRVDFKVAIIGIAAAAPLGVALMAAPVYFNVQQYAGLCFWGGIGLFLLLSGTAVLIAIRDEMVAKREGRRRPVLAIIGMAVFGAAFIGCAAWYFWPNTKAAVNAVAPKSELDEKILLECGYASIPETVPPNGYLELSVGDEGNALWQESMLAPGQRNSAYKTDKTAAPAMAIECRISNHSGGTILNVSATMNLVWMLRTMKGKLFSKIVSTPEAVIANGAVAYFYIRNYSAYDIYFTFPERIQAQKAGHNAEEPRLIAPRDPFAHIDAWPYANEKHSSSAKQPQPAFPNAAHIQFVQKTIPSTDSTIPYVTQIIIQTDTIIENPAFAVVCGSDIESGDLSGPSSMMNVKDGISPDKKTFFFRFGFPAFTPDSPIVVTLHSKAQIQALGVMDARGKF